MRIGLALLTLALVLVGGCGAPPPAPQTTPAGSRPPAPAVQPNAFFDPSSFAAGLRAVQGAPPLAAGAAPLVGGVVPHHALAGANLTTFFRQLEARPPRTVIVVGPNHPLRGQRVITGRLGWATDFGTVEPDLDLASALVAAGLAAFDDRTLNEEHSVGALMPYLRYHAPGARVVPLILHKDLTLAELDQLAGWLAPRLSPETLLVASVDFSHYLTRAEAEAKDAETWAAISAYDLQGLLPMQPDHLDSPPSLILLMLAMHKLGADGPTVEYHTNSGIMMKDDFSETTSYFTITYRQKP